MIDLAPLHLVSHGDDWTPAFNDAVRLATPKGESIKFPADRLSFKSRPKTMGCGITLIGDSGITSAKLGTCCYADYEEHDPDAGFFTWDGSDPRGYKGTGGGIRHMTLYRLGTIKGVFSGGAAIKLICLNNSTFRSGWWDLQNVCVISEGEYTIDGVKKKAAWDHCFLADGRAVPIEGIRWLNLCGFMASGARNHCIDLRNVIHLSWHGGQVQAGPTVDPHDKPDGIRITGKDSNDIHINGVGCYDTLNIVQCKESIFALKAEWVVVNGRKLGDDEAGKVTRCSINIVGCNRMEDYTDHDLDRMKVTYV